MLLSIIIPVYARPLQLDRLLASIARQAIDLSKIQVIVAENRRSLNRFWLESVAWPFHFEYVFVPNGNQAACRNAGARLSIADTMFFVDSDIELSEHTLGHLLAESAVRYRTIVATDVVHPRGSRLTLATRLFDVPEHVRKCRSQPSDGDLAFTRFVSCAFMLRRADFERVGGFAASFTHYGYEDLEFALRAQKAGIGIHLSWAAVVFHHKHFTPEDVPARYFALGQSAVHFARLHPDIEDVIWLGVRAVESDSSTHLADVNMPELVDRARSIEAALAVDTGHRLPGARPSPLVRDGRRLYEEIAGHGHRAGVRTALCGEGAGALVDVEDWGQWGSAERRQEDALLRGRHAFLTVENAEQVREVLDREAALGQSRGTFGGS